ncbi:uncharacterized protein LOC111697628 [Eurytemora carolleeae]|uniref:uncharacterized protein LOC111697628 n=1 Tax=Eurytemora carolleeae TaxID=1294199 RepID=UPI000C78CD98|nr:uncharacterized protein LOC111697628 [Eurytemora carolleeae]|eukprot:XP_023323461.1 uncharacterized protein LOC111697628 [Eurytemora affinis]
MLMLGLGLDLFRPSEGVCHGDELFLLFKLNAIPMDPANAKDKQIRDQMIALWTDFASTHNPTPRTEKWIKFKSSKPQFYEISSESCMKYPGDHKARMEYWANIWENIPASYRKMSSPTWTRYPHNRFPVDVE